jgi:hypothetical protein
MVDNYMELEEVVNAIMNENIPRESKIAIMVGMLNNYPAGFLVKILAERLSLEIDTRLERVPQI